MSTDRLPPHDIDSEEAALGALLIGGDIKTINLSGKDFYSERNQWVYEACQRLSGRDVPINQITVANELANQEKLDNCGGAAFLSHVISMCPTSLDLSYYAEIISRCALYRKMIALSDQIAGLGYKASPNISESINKADELLLELRKGVSPSTIVTPEERINILNERYNKLNLIEAGAAIPTGLIDLDKFLGGGLYDGDLIIIGARASMGKTTFMQNIANNIALNNNVLYFSCEMDTEALGDRDVAGKVGVPINRVRLGNYGDDLYVQILNSLEDLKQYHLYTYDDTPITTSTIMQAATNLQLRHGLKSIVVDYLGLLDDDINENRNITLGHMTKKLKQIARKLNVPIIVAQQLSRALENRDDKRPVLSDLRESGHIEEDADIVMLLYRDSYYYDAESWKKQFPDEEYPSNITEIIVAKQRQGESNRTIRVYFDEKNQKYRDLLLEAANG